MRILIATPLYPPDAGGPATYSKILKEELPKRGIDTRVVSFGEVRHLPKIIRHTVYFFKILRAGKDADIIFAQDPVSVGLPACLASRILRKHFVVKIVGDYAWEMHAQRAGAREFLIFNFQFFKKKRFITPDEFQKQRFGIMAELRRLVERGVARCAARIIVPSAYLKKIMMLWGAPQEKISVIYNSFDPVSISEDKKEIRALLGIDGTVVFSAGRLVPWKGFATLIEILPDILKEFPDTKLYIAGDGPDRDALALKAKDCGLATNIVFLGALPREMLLRYIKAADIFALNTGYEGFSHQLLEAMSIGTPVVSTDVCGNPELIENGKEGVLVSYNNHAEFLAAILEMLRGQIDTETLARAAKEKAAQFTKERMMNDAMRVFSQI